MSTASTPRTTPARCPRHEHAAPNLPKRPFRTEITRLTYKCCGVPVGGADDRAGHYCPCCGDNLDGCLKWGASCPQCGTIDATGKFVVPTDALAELLDTGRTPSEHYPSWQRARDLFGEDVAYHLSVNSDRTREYLGWDLYVQRAGLALRWYHAENQFRAGTACPHPDCRRGQIWTPVTSRAELLEVYRHGPGRRGYHPCSACAYASRR